VRELCLPEKRLQSTREECYSRGGSWELRLDAQLFSRPFYYRCQPKPIDLKEWLYVALWSTRSVV